ncbi:protein FAR1-RELATED SEQUENCE 5-like [Beta vulgaris subsp. vulgaris]|uniref:protein FAR1-RELATED SEQUENCE 5-like n=1 Tax=Beta vulgaris subsp. vulgaris TaxID=3555 RepID=UPI002549ABC6|nr:protein FAR1-RELATED SEQUENCE 5-like [Beta vulgaris subsp. vulgaris]
MYEGFEEFLLADAADNESESANQVIHNQLEVVDATHNENEPLDAMIHNQLQPVDSIVEECTEDELDISGSLIGVQKKTIEELYELYRLHSGALGFSIRKYTSRIGRVEGNVYLTKEKYFVCSCHGKPDGQSDFVSVPDVVDEDGNERKRKQRRVIVTKTGCNAMMRVKLNDSGMYEVIGHVLHELRWQHYHRSERAIGDGKAKEITVMTEASMRPAVQYRYECHQYGGAEALGHTSRDHYNFVNRLKMKAIEGGDAQVVIDKLSQRAADEDDFFYRVKLDSMGRLCNVFWRDSMMKDDYELYGDVTVFDTTYRTNRYNLICGAFVGINNHWKNIMFGCCFLSDETIDTFVWLFEVFKKCMGGVCPVSIFTDQDQAMSNALSQVFPNTRARLCQWHLYQNAVSHFGTLKSDDTFSDAFKKCLRGCYDSVEFEASWDYMMKKYGLEGDKWFARLYQLKDKWSTALSKDFFSAGILSSQRSESTNNAIGFQASKTTSLYDFFGMFQNTISRWRQTETNDEFVDSKSVPKSYFPMTGMLRHASQIYTATMFRDFEQEFGYCLGTICELLTMDDTILVYKVWPEKHPQRTHQVTFDCVNKFVSCSCRNYEEVGMLCYHCLRVLHMHSVSEIPSSYILRRWTKFAKTEVWDRLKQQRVNMSSLKKDCIPWRFQMSRVYNNLIIRSHDNEKARKIMEKGYMRDLADVLTVFANINLGDSESGVGESTASNSSTITVFDPPWVKTKGRSVRPKSGIEKSKRGRGRGKCVSNVAKEFGSYTPPARLF